MRLVINEKGLVCDERDVSLPLQEHKEPWFMRLNLGEEVPVFLHGDTIISDYNQIIDYLEKNFVGGILTMRFLFLHYKLNSDVHETCLLNTIQPLLTASR